MKTQKLLVAVLMPLFFWNVCQAQVFRQVRVEKVCDGDPSEVRLAGMSSNGEYIFTTSGTNKGLKRLSLSDKSLTLITSDQGAGFQPIVSADGQKVVFSSDVWDENHLRQSEFKAQTVGEMIPAQSSNIIPVVSTDNLQLQINIDGESRILNPNGTGEDIRYIWASLSPDATKILYYVSDEGAYVCNLQGGNVQFISPRCLAPQWYDNETVIGMNTRDDGEFIHESSIDAYTLSGEHQQLVSAMEGLMYPHCSAESGRIACSSLKGGVYVINVDARKPQRKTLSAEVKVRQQRREPYLTKPRVYLNAGHGSWGPDDRPMATISHPMLPETGRPDTCGFYESNTNLWKVLKCGSILKGTKNYYLKYSRTKNGPYPYVAGASNATLYNRDLPVISAEVDSWKADLFLSVHSNAAGEGAIANYPLFLYRGTDAVNAVDGSKAMCQTLWKWHIEAMKAGFEPMTAYQSSMNIRGDRDFYHYTWTNDKGYSGYLGVLMHGCPGFLSEGYFHTYQPSRHRALNQDWCCMEGRRYARGIIDYFGTEPDSLGCIMGQLRCKAKSSSSLSLYNFMDGTDDQYLPINGATVRLKDKDGYILDVYEVDMNYNGIFIFTDLKPGTYYVEGCAEGYKTFKSKLTTYKFDVKANATTMKTVNMTVGTSTPLEPIDAIHHVQEDESISNADRVVRIYDINGSLVLTTTHRAMENSHLPAGIYVMECGGKAVKYCVK